jgi:hypothetical protein
LSNLDFRLEPNALASGEPAASAVGSFSSPILAMTKHELLFSKGV